MGGSLDPSGLSFIKENNNVNTQSSFVRKICACGLVSLVAHLVWADSPILADDLIWLPIGDSITEGEQYMGHADQGDVNTRGGYRYQLWREMEEEYGQSTISVGYRTGHQGTVEDPATCHWAWHAAQYGGVIMHDSDGSHGAAGMDVESTLEVAGYPDVITVLIGVNDCSFTDKSDAQIGKVFTTWQNMLVKLSTLRPKSTICVSTLLPAGGDRSYIDKFNTLVRNAVNANEEPFNCANVVFADMHQDAFGGTFNSQYFKGDSLHPNETGAKLIGAAFSKYLKDVVADRATHAAELVSVDNGTAGFVTVRFNKALKSVTSATLTITGTDVEDEEVTLTLTNGAIDATNQRLLKFATSEALKGGTYTATIALAGTDGNGLELPASLTLDDSEFVEILGSGAENNVPASLRDGLTKHGTLTMADGAVSDGIGSGDNFAGNGPGEQFATASELPQYVKRVAYYMELKRPGQPAQFVWASMDATTGFSSNSARVGIPTTTSGNVKALVNNLQVYGNRGNFTNSEIDADGNSADVGIVEFSPYDWSATDQAGFPQDFNANYNGWNDTLGTSTLKGCMQIAKVLRTSGFDNYTNPGAEMLFAYNNFNCATATDIAIGSFSTHRKNNGNTCTVVNDWTDFVANTAYEKFAVNAYEVKKLEIWFEEGEAPQVLDIPAGDTVIKSASDPLTVPVTGEGRLVLENYLPTDSTILESLQNGETWTGTVEIRNYAPTANYGIIYFQNYANANSTVALNSVTVTMYTGEGTHPDQSFGALEIMDGGWTTGTGDFTINPLYNCNLKGSGPITINHRGKNGTVYFCGDHSNFSGSINFATNADKGVVLAPAGTGRTTGIAAKNVMIHANTTTSISGSTNGTVVGSGTIVSDGAMPSAAIQKNLKATTWTGTLWLKNITSDQNRNPSVLGNSSSTVRYTNVSGWMNSGAYDPTVDIVNGANGNGFTFTNGSSGWETGKIVKFARLTGTGTLKLNWSKTFPLHLPDVSGFTGTINCAQANGIGVILGSEATISEGGSGKIAIPAAAEVQIAYGTTWTAANGVVGTGKVKVPAINNAAFLDVRKYGNDTTVELAGVSGNNSYPINANTTTSPKVVLAGDVAFCNGFGGYTLTWSEVSGTGNFSVSKGSNGIQNYIISTLKGYTGAITAKSNTTLTIGKVVTTLTETPATATKVVTFGSGCVKDKVIVTNLAICLANGTDITEDVTIEKTNAGITIVKKAPALPEWINDQSEEQVAAYNTWAEANGVTDPTTAKHEAFAFNCANDDDAIVAEKEAFVITSITIVDGVVTVTAKSTNTASEAFNITPVIKGSATVNGDYNLNQDDEAARFFKAFIEL